MLLPMKELLLDAQRNNYAIPAINVTYLESIQAVITAAQEEQSPVIVAVYEGNLDSYISADLYGEIVRVEASKVNIPISLHLDHAKTLDKIVQAIRGGFSSVMIDGSSLPFEGNVAITKQVSQLAHAVGVSVEGDIGHMTTGDELPDSYAEMQKLMTDPREAREFVAQTGVDALAVCVGTAHGHYKFPPKIDIERLKEIRSLTEVPLVLHGGSGTPKEEIREAIRHGIAKINVGTDYMLLYTRSISDYFSTHGVQVKPVPTFLEVRERLVEFCREKIREFRDLN